MVVMRLHCIRKFGWTSAKVKQHFLSPDRAKPFILYFLQRRENIYMNIFLVQTALSNNLHDKVSEDTGKFLISSLESHTKSCYCQSKEADMFSKSSQRASPLPLFWSSSSRDNNLICSDQDKIKIWLHCASKL